MLDKPGRSGPATSAIHRDVESEINSNRTSSKEPTLHM
jgi:hypothetical protein